MKKFLLSLAAVLGMGAFAYAETYTYTAEEMNITDASQWAVGGFTFTTAKNDGSTTPTYNAKNKDVRIYAKGTIDVAAEGANITSIVFDLSAQGVKRQAPITASVGTVAEQSKEIATISWTGNAANVKFTVGEKAEYGTDDPKDNGDLQAGQFDWSSITITTDKAVGEVVLESKNAIYAKATTMAEGKYVISALNLIATPLTSGYGYLKTVDGIVKNDEIIAAKANAFDFVATDGGYYIKDAQGFFYCMKGTYNSFNRFEEIGDPETEGYVWTVKFEADGTAIITNVLMNKYVQYSENYASFGAYAEPQVSAVVPALYKYSKDTDEDPLVPEKSNINNLPETAYSVAQITKILKSGDFNADNEVYVAGIITSITEGTFAQYNNCTYFIGDTEDATETMQVYAGNYIGGEAFTSEDQIKVGDKVVVFGKAKLYNGTPELDKGNYIYSLNGQTSGISGVAAEAGVAAYYNLQGVRVLNPAQGQVYIRVLNGKAAKIVK